MLDGFQGRVKEAAQSVLSKHGQRPAVGLILGSGLGSFVQSVEGTDIPRGEIRGLPVPTAEGHAGFLRLSTSVAVMAGAVGADLVGMSTVPEVIAARYLGIEVHGLSMVTNMAAGILDQPLSQEEVVETAARVAPRLSVLLKGILARLCV